MTDIQGIAAGFRFTLSIAGEDGMQGSFSDVSGLRADIEAVEAQEGSENRFKHRLPKPGRGPTLIMKRGVLTRSGPLVAWLRDTLEGQSGQFSPKDLTVSLMDMAQAPTMQWTISRASPLKWTLGRWDDRTGEVAVEAVAFVYNDIRRVLIPRDPAS